MANYWFKPKRYGYGATPVTWQGWAVTAAAVIVIAGTAHLIVTHHAASPWAWIAFFAIEAVVIAALWIFTRRKTDGEWRWRWGNDQSPVR
jgi:hypothetical protein